MKIDDALEIKQKVGEYITGRLEEDKIAAVTFALTDGEEIACTGAYGYSDVENKVPAREDMVIGIASVSKLFTATGIMQLEEAGKLDIENPVTDYIPEFSIKSRYKSTRAMKVKDLMTHISGLPRDWLVHFYNFEPDPIDSLVADIKNDYLTNPPGYFYNYSNLGVSLLGVVLERAAGIPFAEYMQKNILDPLGMAAASFALSPNVLPYCAKAYRGLEPAVEVPVRDKPAGGLYTNVLELAKFAMMYACGGVYKGQRLLKSETIDRMLTPQILDVPLSFGAMVGLNWFIGRGSLDYAGLVAGHGGALVYHRSDLCVLPEQGLAFMLMSNSSTGNAVFGRACEIALQGAVYNKTGLKPEKTQPKPFSLHVSLRGDVPEGHYGTPDGYIFIYKKDDAYMMKLEENEYPLVFENDNYVPKIKTANGYEDDDKISWRKMKFIYEPELARKIMLVNNHPFGEGYEPEAVPEKWSERQGFYRAFNRRPDEDLNDIMNRMELEVKHGRLYATFIHDWYRQRRLLRPVNDYEAARMGWGGPEGETLHAKPGEGDVLEFMGIKFRRETGQPIV